MIEFSTLLLHDCQLVVPELDTSGSARPLGTECSSSRSAIEARHPAEARSPSSWTGRALRHRPAPWPWSGSGRRNSLVGGMGMGMGVGIRQSTVLAAAADHSQGPCGDVLSVLMLDQDALAPEG